MNIEQDTTTRGGDHSKEMTIVVNTRPKVVTVDELTFDQVVALADNLVTGPNVVYTITYRRGHGHKPQGTLTEGESVKIKDGMIFSVSATDKS